MYRSTHMIKKNKKTRTVTLYIKPEYDETYRQMAEYLQREGKSFSDWVWERARRFVEHHKAGNSQQDLVQIIENGKAFKSPDECRLCDRKSVVEAHYKDKKVKVCLRCLKELKRVHGQIGYRKI